MTFPEYLLFSLVAMVIVAFFLGIVDTIRSECDYTHRFTLVVTVIFLVVVGVWYTVWYFGLRPA